VGAGMDYGGDGARKKRRNLKRKEKKQMRHGFPVSKKLGRGGERKKNTRKPHMKSKKPVA